MISPLSTEESFSTRNPGTSALGELGAVSAKLPMLLLGGSMALGTTAGDDVMRPQDQVCEFVMDRTTGTGAHWDVSSFSAFLQAPVEHHRTDRAVICELRRRSGLTWDQIAEVMGVERRSVHFWASGKEPSARNQERLRRVLAVVRGADRGSANETRLALLETDLNGVNALDLVKAGDYKAARDRLAGGFVDLAPHKHRQVRVAEPLGPPPSPQAIVGALHDPVHAQSTRSRIVLPARAKKKE